MSDRAESPPPASTGSSWDPLKLLVAAGAAVLLTLVGLGPMSASADAAGLRQLTGRAGCLSAGSRDRCTVLRGARHYLSTWAVTTDERGVIGLADGRSIVVLVREA